jgi:signal transduction histidine kinase
LIWAELPDRELFPMNDVVSEIAIPRQDVTLVRGSARGNQFAGVNPAAHDDLIHELRQPLSTIDALAYFLEITSADDAVRAHLQRIQAMVSRAHGILDRSSNIRGAKPSAA